MSALNRRELIKAGASLALFTGFSPSPLWAAPLGANPFMLGVASGDPWPDGFVIWTRLAPRPLEEHAGMPAARVPVRWEVAEDMAFSKVVRQGEAMALPELAHSVHVEVAGLRPHRHYWYRFSVAGSDISPIGMTRTAPLATDLIDHMRIGVAGCQHYEMGFFDAWRHLAEEPDLDLIFHYGDYIYEGGATKMGPRPNSWTPVRQHVGDEIYSIDDYRRRYAQYKSDPHLMAAHAACAFAATFDDHEVDNNWASDFDQDGTDPKIFALRRFAALQAWYEHMPVRKAQFPKQGGLVAHRRLHFGQLLQMHLLDTRSYRADQPCGDDFYKNPCPPEAHMAPTVLGEAQEKWLDDGLGTGSAAWNLLAQQIIVMPVDFRKEDATEAQFATDLWDGYRPARKRLIETIRKHQLRNVIIATGDHHRHLVGTVPENDEILDGPMVAVEFQAASISSNGNGKGEAGLGHMMKNNPHFDLYTDRRGYQLFDITPKSWQADVKIMDQVEMPGGKISTMASFVVTPDAPVLHRN
ncbi:alkaline phosphatase D family protein [Sphingopyxis yananensis]|uniref:alkaline phosphatase D family protein n=1 Tax=Sphingopyxis yananensis TaxID=2886687 RepID=UPI001D11628B|nr:alkaline phosphatase D family protein [Sphingopyxis yananensis]MCC2601272.1 alkaline phosphatase D family protein [Sphingopyxis yananensis]